jgi:hypothetical protein
MGGGRCAVRAFDRTEGGEAFSLEELLSAAPTFFVMRLPL